MLSRLINQASHHNGLGSKVFRPTLSAFSTTPEGGADPLKADKRTQKPQEEAHATDEATKDSIRHAAEGNVKEAVKDIGEMAKNAATGAAQSSKLMMDSMRKKTTGKSGGGVPKSTEERK